MEKWQTTSSKTLVNDKWLKLRVDSCVTPAGGIVPTYYVLEYGPWANCVVIDTDNNLIMIRQYRHGIDERKRLATAVGEGRLRVFVAAALAARRSRFRLRSRNRAGRSGRVRRNSWRRRELSMMGPMRGGGQGPRKPMRPDTLRRVIRAFAPLLKASGDAVVINVSSVSAFTGSGSNIGYCAAKAALDTMTMALARALGPEIRVLCVSPAAVATDFVAGRGRPQLEKIAQGTPLKRVVEADDIARAVMACITHLKVATGARIVTDGGRWLN